MSRNKLRLSNGAGLIGVFFGFLFTASGLFVIFVVFGMMLDQVGLVAFFKPPQPPADWRICLGIGGVFLIGLGHLAGGSFLLWTLRTTIDRDSDLVVVRTGWLGFRKQVRKLSACKSLTIQPNAQPAYRFGDSDFEIVLQSDPENQIVIAYVTRSRELASEIAKQIVDFSGLEFGLQTIDEQNPECSAGDN